MSRNQQGNKKEKNDSVTWLQSGSTEARSAGALCIW